MLGVKRYFDCSGFVHKGTRYFYFLILFGESDDVTSLYPNDRFVTGKWDTRRFIDMYRESSKEVLQMLVNVTFFNTRHILIILIVQMAPVMGSPSLIS